ncbi:MAG: hypothetical protein SCALA702_26190 [Melioribacteraceae bacterium]|nr:MAG: hypothetical protein SCALA702_26190 [Melioribacteraceae bacterium]
MERKDFLKRSALAIAATAFNFTAAGNLVARGKSSPVVKKEGDLVAVMGGKPSEMLNRAVTELGGISNYVKPGDKVVVKPNIGWAKTPEMAANTNPDAVGEMVKLCMEAGAKEVVIFDHTCNDWRTCYEKSGIEEAGKKYGAIIVPGNDKSYYKEVDIPEGIILKKAMIHKSLLECDVWFNMPVLKNHGGAKMTLSMKNYMGIVWDRQIFHREGLQQAIADICTFAKKPALNIIDGYRTLTQNGPMGKGVEDVLNTGVMFASKDIIAVDTAAVKYFSQIKEMSLDAVSHIGLGEKFNLGTTNLDNMNVKRVKL